jgi:hypothetical protein
MMTLRLRSESRNLFRQAAGANADGEQRTAVNSPRFTSVSDGGPE